MLTTFLLAVTSLVIAAEPAPSLHPWGDPNGPEPCFAAPQDADTLCKSLYAIECMKYRNSWHGCEDSDDPARCRQDARDWYEFNIDNISCGNHRHLVSELELGDPIDVQVGPRPCYAGPSIEESWVCHQIYLFACRNYQRAYDACHDSEDPNQCYQDAWATYLGELTLFGCDGTKRIPDTPENRQAVEALSTLIGAIPDSSIGLVLDLLK